MFHLEFYFIIFEHVIKYEHQNKFFTSTNANPDQIRTRSGLQLSNPDPVWTNFGEKVRNPEQSSESGPKWGHCKIE